MIGKLKGLVEEIGHDQLLLDVGGVCYGVFAPASTLARLALGQACALHIITHVREDHIHLYGFAGAEEKAWFETLTSVQGVGPKVGLAILSTLTPTDMANALMLEDKRPFQSVTGVGPKVAARLVTELREKANKIGTATSVNMTPAVPTEVSGDAALMRDLISALTNLGYDGDRARTAGATALAEAGEDADLNALIPLALKSLAN